MADPGVEKTVRLSQDLDRLARISVLQKHISFKDFRVRLRLGLDFRGQPGDQWSGLAELICVDQHPCRQESNFHRLAIQQCLFGGRNGCALLSPQDVCVGQ